MKKHQIVSVSALLAIALIWEDNRCAFAIPEGANSAVFGKVCKLLQLQEKGAPEDEPDITATAEVAEIEAINMSLSDAKWQALFIGDNNKKKDWAAADEATKSANPTWATKWDAWANAKQRVLEKTETDTKIKKSSLVTITQETRPLALARLQGILAEVSELESELNNQQEAATAGKKAAVDELLRQATFGGEAGKGEFGKNSGATGGADAIGNCGSEGKIGNDHPIAYIGICLAMCASGDSGNNPKPLSDPAGTNAMNGGGGDAKANYEAMRKLCSTSSSVHATAETIRAALADLHSSVVVKTNAGYLGWAATSTCDGTSNNGLCVKYGTSIRASKDEFDKLTFATKLKQAAKLQEERRKALAKQGYLKSAIASKLKAVYELGIDVKALADHTQAHVLSNSRTNTGAAPSQQEAATTCNGVEKAADCRKNGSCKWEGPNEKDGKHCKLNEINVGKQETQAVVEAAAPATRCAKHGTDKTKCDADKSCKWEGETCKESSFLVNKKLDLSMAAAFVNSVAL
uniref:Variant surface glycoprotein 1125.4304 n=1 Tax=Trypanosoma brucei TaxID=5691 RepID=A0A1J0RAL1_9TRYP|nr:variant surface glycoprotein 1125.4304 [Trypanosoma brucei]